MCRAWAVAAAVGSVIAAWAGPEDLPLLGDQWPRAFMFRHSEGHAARGVEWAVWDAAFSPLSGIMGKVLEEEVPGRAASQPYFTRFKDAHPEQAVLLHYNGRSRDPRDASGDYFAGHWLYLEGCSLVQELPAETGKSVLHVEDPTRFRTGIGRYNDSADDIGICAVGEGGRPDWTRSEQVELIAVDVPAKTLTVRRGAHGTAPRAFPAGSYVAAHASEGPWGRRSHLLWYYNFATTCPRDAQGRTCADVLVGQFRAWFADDGPLAAFDGVEFDVAMFDASSRPYGRGIDADADGLADDGIIGGVNVYGIGVHRFYEGLREALGEDVLVMADGAGWRHQRSMAALNGIESEGWPDLGDWEIVDWAGGINRHAFWRDNARTPALSYINHKYNAPGDQPPPELPFSRHRLVFAAGLMTDSAITYSLLPPAPSGALIGVWDELCMGAEGRAGWLGRPVGETVRLAARGPDLLEGAGAAISDDFLAHWSSDGSGIARVGDPTAMRINRPGGDTRLVLEGVDAPAGDLTVLFTVRAEPRAGYPETIPRLLWVGLQGAGELIAASAPRTGRVSATGVELSLDADATGALVRYMPTREIEGERHAAYFVHPPYRAGADGATFWEREVRVPEERPVLRFFTGLSPAPAASDGLGFAVEVRASGRSTRVFEALHTEFQWLPHEVDLSRWAGARVVLRFLADAGPAGNATADHGAWGDAFVDGAGPRFVRSALCPARVMTWVGAAPFAAGAYFRDVGPATVNLTLEIEGPEPFYVSDFAIHAAPDAMAREYEGGAVLANPSAHEVTFDLATLFPGGSFRRLQGTTLQDPRTNNGEPVGATVTLGPRDALFLARR